ncbi:MAG: RnfH family protein [Coxiellaceae bacterium]|nr:RnfH family protein [Coxiellaceae bacterium]
MLKISVIYATSTEQVEIPLEVEANCNVAIAIRRSGILERFPQLELASLSLGIFSQAAKLDDSLHDGDRIEIYRPLEIDPKQARLLRAARAKKKHGS